MQWEPVIGLEIHVQLATQTKAFCNSPACYGAPPNTLTCPVCLGLPGTLPVLNGEAVVMALKAAMALDCRIAQVSHFARKNYFYPDLPKGYQITQYEHPIAEDGHLELKIEENSKHIVGILRVHLEEDAGKSIHRSQPSPTTALDYNRAGVPLLEIVTHPDLHNPDMAIQFLKEVHHMVRWLGISDANMEEGSFRCDANLSIRPVGTRPLAPKTEIKNLNSFRAVHRALRHEFQRQMEVAQGGGKVAPQTLLWNEEKNRTEVMREKETGADYRYFPEPDLPPLVIDDEMLQQVKESMPESPVNTRRRFVEDHGLLHREAEELTTHRVLAEIFEAVVREGASPREASVWLRTEFLHLVKKANLRMTMSSPPPVDPSHLAQLIVSVEGGNISRMAAKRILEEMFQTGAPPHAIINKHNLGQVTDEHTLSDAMDSILQSHPQEAERLTKGEMKLMGFFMGQIMEATNGTADPKVAKKVLLDKVKGPIPANDHH